jgi:hypothetical protein
MDDDQFQDELILECKNLLQVEDDLEEVIGYLRKRTGRKSLSIKIMSICLDIPIGKANILISNSKTWEDKKESDKKLEETFIRSLEKLAEE